MTKKTTYFSLFLIATLLFQLVVIPFHKVFAYKNEFVESNIENSLTVKVSHEHSDCFICDNDHYLPALVNEVFLINTILFLYAVLSFFRINNSIPLSNNFNYKLRGPPFLFLN